MKPGFRYKKYSRKKGRPHHRKRKLPVIKPGADASLNKIFAGIGTPTPKPFQPDRFQLEALDVIRQSDCLVTAPTGAGKTWIAEQAIAMALEAGKRTWYASPLKALSNSKYSEFSHAFGAHRVGILTGDRKENTDAPVIIGTTEILRNQLYDAMHRGETLATDLVILDEAHYLGDDERGVVWEETMIYLPRRIPLLMLSATVGNADDIAAWLSSVRERACQVVRELHRPVPLTPLFLHPNGTLFPLMAQQKKKTRNRLHKKVQVYLKEKRPLFMAPPSKLPPFTDILKILKKYRLLPALFFLKSRSDCNRAIEMCRYHRSEDPEVTTRRLSLIQEWTGQNSHISRHRQREILENQGVGAHHAGQLPAWKLLLEHLMTKGLLDAVFATSTVAAGVNFPARTAVLLNSDRFNGKEFLPLDPTQFHQMTGRAGRRGMDRIGFAIALPGRYMDLRHAGRLIGSPPSNVYSRIQINFSMVLNLLLSHTPEQIEDLLRRSFAAFLIKKHGNKSGDRTNPMDGVTLLTDQFRKHLSFLVEKAYVSGDGDLTDDGVWASRLRVDQPLVIAEGFRIGAFPTDDPALLAAIIAAIVNDRDMREKKGSSRGDRKLLRAFRDVEKRLRPFQRHMASRSFETRPLSFVAASTLYRWMKEETWEDVVAASSIEEGDLVMLVLRTADNLRHIRALYPYFPDAAEAAKKAIDIMLREPVTMAY